MKEITKESFEKFVNKEFPGRNYRWDYKDGHGYMYIQAGTGQNFSDEDIHYEYYDGQVRVHIEGDRWWSIRRDLSYILQRHPELKGEVWQKRQNCQWVLKTEEKDIFDMFLRLRSIVEEEISAYDEGRILLDNNFNPDQVEFDENVPVYDVFKQHLVIPSYQRIYVWKKEQVKTLLDDIASVNGNIDYHIGSIILHEHPCNNDKSILENNNTDKEQHNECDVVDGQQRLVTLAIIIHTLGNDSADLSRFLQNHYESNEALSNIRDNKNFIESYLKDERKRNLIESNIKRLCLSILTIKNTGSLDLAFTFFSNANSRGKKLTDYDLLKPHHLRYIPSDLEDQQFHLAKKWDAMILSQQDKEKYHGKEIDYIRLMENCLYRLRKWSSWKNEDLSVDHYIKKEFEAAPIIYEVPPFGERFNYMEPIQGGQHFFAYVEHFLEKYKTFELKELLHRSFGFEGSWSWYGNVIEALIFCYYLRFGNSYICEASLSIIRFISVSRFNTRRAYEPTILRWALQSKIPLLIERATSPTFFLAEIERKIENITDKEEADKGIRQRYYKVCSELCGELNKNTTVNYYNDYFKTRYENGKICTNS